MAMSVTSLLFVYFSIVCLAEASSRNDRLWPVGQSSSVDLPQSSPFGPRLQISQNSRYDFHRGVDIPIPIGTPLVAIDNGTVSIGGSHSAYSDGVVQIIHEGWNEDPDSKFYVNYIHIINSTVTEGEDVVKGQIVAYSYRSFSLFEHVHFEVRAGGLYQRHCCNPWKYLPNVNNSYTSFKADIQLQPNYNNVDCEAVVNISVPPDQLTMNRIELHIVSDGMESVRTFDFCEDNLDHSFAELDDPLFEQNLYVSPGLFSSRSYGRGENATYGLHFLNLTETQGDSGTLRAAAYDVFGNRVETALIQYTCSSANANASTSSGGITQQTTDSKSSGVSTIRPETGAAMSQAIALVIAIVACYI